LHTGHALFLDVDGTLLEFAERPDIVHVDPGLLTLLSAACAALQGAVAFISGRSVADLDRLFAPLRLPAAGQHGLERRDAAGGVHRHAAPLDAMRKAQASLRGFVRSHAGLVLEEKGFCLALHYRQAPTLEAAAVAAATQAAAALGTQFELQRGKMVVEVKPSGRDKGSAIAEFMQEAPFSGRAPVFAGDDLTDELGFRIVDRAGGTSVKVGPGASVARFRLSDARAVRAWLGHIATPASSIHVRGPE
jgi:trehalose 6-phosphate phosphatase